MRSRFKGVMITVVAAALVSALWLAMTPAAGQLVPGQFPVYRAPHMADGHPDLNGIWYAFVIANWDI